MIHEQNNQYANAMYSPVSRETFTGGLLISRLKYAAENWMKSHGSALKNLITSWRPHVNYYSVDTLVQ